MQMGMESSIRGMRGKYIYRLIYDMYVTNAPPLNIQPMFVFSLLGKEKIRQFNQ